MISEKAVFNAAEKKKRIEKREEKKEKKYKDQKDRFHPLTD